MLDVIGPISADLDFLAIFGLVNEAPANGAFDLNQNVAVVVRCYVTIECFGRPQAEPLTLSSRVRSDATTQELATSQPPYDT